MEKRKVLGVELDLVTRQETINLIDNWIKNREETKLVVTAYSEFFVLAQYDRDFRMALEGADLVTPDGAGPLAAIRYQQKAKGKRQKDKLLAGLGVGMDILRGRVGETVSGYWLFRELTRLAVEKDWRIFLLGGFDDEADEVAKKLKIENGQLTIGHDGGAQTDEEMIGVMNERVIEKINKFAPDLLFVAYGPGKQEKWLTENRNKLKVKVAMGVGGTFDEYLGRVREVPIVMEKYGLKWLWRLIQQPQRIRRIWRAVVVFPWLVFGESSK